MASAYCSFSFSNTLRKEIGYEDFRHPNKIEFTNRLEDDVIRRDISINALYLDKNLNKGLSTGNYINSKYARNDKKVKGRCFEQLQNIHQRKIPLSNHTLKEKPNEKQQ